MVSKAIAALDVWLATAEEVLQEHREQSISPSSAWRQSGETWTMSMATFKEGLEGLLASLCERPGRWILIVEDGACPSHFCQVLIYEDGSLVAEVVSNRFLAGRERLSSEDEGRLVELGWEPPNPPNRPNWIVIEPTMWPQTASAASRVASTLKGVFKLADEDIVVVRLFSSPLRGSTPANPLAG